MEKKNRVRGRAAAIIGMIVLIAVSIPVGSCISLARERGSAAERYYGSDDEWGLLEDLSWCSTEAANLATLAGKYLPQDDERIADVQRAREEMGKAEKPGDKAAAFSRLTAKVNALGNALEAAGLPEEDETYRKEILADYNSDADFINRSDYNTEAARFNEILRSTPARGLAELVGIEPLELFQ